MPLLLSLLFFAVQLTQPPTIVRGSDFEIVVPQGWTAKMVGVDAVLEHSSGASLVVLRSRTTQEVDSFASREAERIATPLGFATIGEPRHFRNSNQEWVEYDIRGNRLTERRRILCRVIRSDAGLLEIIYENSNDRYDILLSEALAIPSSLKSIPRKVRVRQ